MIWKLDKDYLYGTEEKALVKQGIEAIQTVLLGKDSSAKRRLLFYLDQYLDPFYQNDLSELNLYRRDCFWHHGRLTHFICFLSSLYDRITETGFFEMQITGKSNRLDAGGGGSCWITD
jgi:hypothetical protein